MMSMMNTRRQCRATLELEGYDTTQNIVGKAVIHTLRLFDMLISSKKSVVDLKKAKQLCCVILKFQECVFQVVTELWTVISTWT